MRLNICMANDNSAYIVIVLLPETSFEIAIGPKALRLREFPDSCPLAHVMLPCKEKSTKNHLAAPFTEVQEPCEALSTVSVS